VAVGGAARHGPRPARLAPSPGILKRALQDDPVTSEGEKG
jgi:hypothetical protein